MPEFKARVSNAERSRLKEFLAALRVGCKSTISKNSEIASKKFESEFRSKLLIQHCYLGTPLFQESFDAAFIDACKASGHDVQPAQDGQRFWDVQVDGKRVSLKSTKARDLRDDSLHISKLTEAAWIQDCRTASKRHKETNKLFDKYCAEVDLIVQLRFFAARNFYELVEIPVAIFEQISEVDKSHYSADGPTINIPVGKDPPDFTLKLDRSDAKITLANINKSVCNVAATWQL